MGLRRLMRQTVIFGLLGSLFITCSLGNVATAASGVSPIGEITVIGTEAEAVRINGEPAVTGRTVFDHSTIVTSPAGAATINIGGAGKLELGPGTSFVISKTGDTVSGTLSAGTVRSMVQGPVRVRTLAGDAIVNTGEAIDAASTAPTQTRSSRGVAPWVWVALAAGIGAVIVIVLTRGGDDNENISPVS